jgi:hypothetical protein
MQRRIVQIAKMCVSDVRVGDAVGTDPNNTRGWFVVDEVVSLTSGDVALVGNRGRSTITANPRDVVGIQVRQTVEMAVEEPAPVAADAPVPDAPVAEEPQAQEPAAGEASAA